MPTTSTERGRKLRAKNLALGRKRPDIYLTDAEKFEVKKLLKAIRNNEGYKYGKQ